MIIFFTWDSIWFFIQSLYAKARTPMRSSTAKIRPTDTEKNIRRHVFSLRAPMHPQKPMTNITPPLIMKMRAGSRVTVVILPMFENMSFSVQAQSPIAQIPAPTSQNKTLNPNIKYFIQQLTSDLSCRIPRPFIFLFLRFSMIMVIRLNSTGK